MRSACECCERAAELRPNYLTGLTLMLCRRCRFGGFEAFMAEWREAARA